MRKSHDPWLDREPVRLPAAARPNLFVVVDTEEEFDWSAPLSRDQRRVTAIRHIPRLQRILERYDVAPTYVIDYPVATQPESYELLRDLATRQVCRIGAHLHPWVNPPYDEEVSPRHSYACNLTADLEAAKLRMLKAAICEHIGTAPTTYKAGRYGFGPSTLRALDDLGFDIDASINPSMDYSADGGPSFREFDASPFFFGTRCRLLEVPCTTAHTGLVASAGPAVTRIANTPLGRAARVGGICSRLRLAETLHLSPEHSSLAEMRRLTMALLARGVRTFALTFHSPSLGVGHTPYVRTSRDLDRLLGSIDAYCEFFRHTLDGTTMPLDEFRSYAWRHRAADAPFAAAVQEIAS